MRNETGNAEQSVRPPNPNCLGRWLRIIKLSIQHQKYFNASSFIKEVGLFYTDNWSFCKNQSFVHKSQISLPIPHSRTLTSTSVQGTKISRSLSVTYVIHYVSKMQPSKTVCADWHNRSLVSLDDWLQKEEKLVHANCLTTALKVRTGIAIQNFDTAELGFESGARLFCNKSSVHESQNLLLVHNSTTPTTSRASKSLGAYCNLCHEDMAVWKLDTEELELHTNRHLVS